MNSIEHQLYSFLNSIEMVHINTIISILTFLLAYKAYKRFLARNVKDMQLRLILELIESLHKETITIEIIRTSKMGYTGGGSINKHNLFRLSKEKELKENLPLYQPVNFGWFSSAFLFAGNPLLPHSISLSIRQMGERFSEGLTSIESSKYAIIGNKLEESKIEDTDIAGEYRGGLNQLILDCRKINNELVKWLRKYGIRDINHFILK